MLAGRGKHYRKKTKKINAVNYGVNYGLLLWKVRCFFKGICYSEKILSLIRPKKELFLLKIGQNKVLFVMNITEYYGFYRFF